MGEQLVAACDAAFQSSRAILSHFFGLHLGCEADAGDVSELGKSRLVASMIAAWSACPPAPIPNFTRCQIEERKMMHLNGVVSVSQTQDSFSELGWNVSLRLPCTPAHDGEIVSVHFSLPHDYPMSKPHLYIITPRSDSPSEPHLVSA